MKRPPGSDHEIGHCQVYQVEVDRRPHRLVEDHLVQKYFDHLRRDLTPESN